MKFENKLDICHLCEVITAWALNTDGYDFAIGGILTEIPYSTEMDEVVNWDDVRVHDAIDTAIGKRYDFNGKDFRNMVSAQNEFAKFYSWVEQTANRVYCVYDGIINMLNDEYEKSKVISSLPIGTYFVDINKDNTTHGNVYRVTENRKNGGFMCKNITQDIGAAFLDGIRKDCFAIIPNN